MFLRPFIFISTIVAVVALPFSLLLVATPLFAQTATTGSSDQAVADRQAQLQAQLDQVLQQIAAQQQILSQEQQKGKSLAGDIAILNAQISEAKLKIQAHNIAIAALGKDINAKDAVITTLSGKIEDSQQSLAQLVRKTHEIDAYSLVDVVLSDQNISAFFIDTDALDSVKESIQVALGEIKQNKATTEQAKQQLNDKQVQETNAKISIQDEESKVQAAETQKNYLLSLSKAQQKSYQTVLSQQQAKAASIRSALFALRDTGAIPFGKALDFANAASKVTGVSPAFLLAILTQESNLGQNVGSCYVTNETTGSGIKVSTGAAVANVMKPTRDIQPFLRITSAVGRDPMQTRVSCPIGGSGYGGAMGPSQFIPSTWELFQNRIASALGIASPDPWNPQDAFMASAIYLSDLGAGGGTDVADRNAACRYYSGRTCDSKSPANSFYGDQVLAKMRSIQVNMIDPLSGN